MYNERTSLNVNLLILLNIFFGAFRISFPIRDLCHVIAFHQFKMVSLRLLVVFFFNIVFYSRDWDKYGLYEYHTVVQKSNCCADSILSCNMVSFKWTYRTRIAIRFSLIRNGTLCVLNALGSILKPFTEHFKLDWIMSTHVFEFFFLNMWHSEIYSIEFVELILPQFVCLFCGSNALNAIQIWFEYFLFFNWFG